MTYQIVIPIYAELPHIEANLRSLEDWDHLLIVDNSKDSWCKKFEELGAKVLYHPENIGVARSWNLGIKEGKDYTFFISSSVKFNYPFRFVANRLDQMVKDQIPGIEHGLFTQLGWHCNAISQLTVEKVGYFDENFYPAYEEDVDYCYRLYLAGIHPNSSGETLGGVVPMISIDAKPIDIAVTIKQAGLHVDFNKLRNYYIEKWGGDHAKEKWTMPFGDVTATIADFPTHSIEELKEKYGL